MAQGTSARVNCVQFDCIAQQTLSDARAAENCAHPATGLSPAAAAAATATAAAAATHYKQLAGHTNNQHMQERRPLIRTAATHPSTPARTSMPNSRKDTIMLTGTDSQPNSCQMTKGRQVIHSTRKRPVCLQADTLTHKHTQIHTGVVKHCLVRPLAATAHACR